MHKYIFLLCLNPLNTDCAQRKKQEKILLAHIEECRLLYNQLICARVQAWEKNKESLSRYEQQATLPMLKQQRKSFSLVYSQVLQQVCQRVDWAFKGFFRRLKERAKTGEKAGFPRYRGKGTCQSTAQVGQSKKSVAKETRENA